MYLGRLCQDFTYISGHSPRHNEAQLYISVMFTHVHPCVAADALMFHIVLAAVQPKNSRERFMLKYELILIALNCSIVFMFGLRHAEYRVCAP